MGLGQLESTGYAGGNAGAPFSITRSGGKGSDFIRAKVGAGKPRVT